MAQKIKEVDQYINKAEDFAQPILKQIREIVHSSSNNIQEEIKWGAPHFTHKGIVCSMASFKKHCAFVFWKGSEMDDPDKIFSKVGKTAMGQLGKLTTVKDLPSKNVLKKYIKNAIQLNETETKSPTKKVKSKVVVPKMPTDFKDALGKNKKAEKVFNGFAPSHKKEYLEWIIEAKREETRIKRIKTAVEWISEGKGRNWKYEKC